MQHPWIVWARSWIARFLARLFYQVVDPQVEFELAAPEEYIRIQQLRRRQMERFVAEYLGPRL